MVGLAGFGLFSPEAMDNLSERANHQTERESPQRPPKDREWRGASDESQMKENIKLIWPPESKIKGKEMKSWRERERQGGELSER